MRGARATLIAILLVGMAVTASAGDMVLARNGEFYRVAPSNDGLVVNHRFNDGTVAGYLIPQTAGIAATSVQVGVDEQTGAIFVVWQTGDELDAVIHIAWLANEWWRGPYSIAGGQGTAVENPQMLIDRVVTVIEEDGESIEVATSFLHLVWWDYLETREDGSALLASSAPKYSAILFLMVLEAGRDPWAKAAATMEMAASSATAADRREDRLIVVGPARVYHEVLARTGRRSRPGASGRFRPGPGPPSLRGARPPPPSCTPRIDRR